MKYVLTLLGIIAFGYMYGQQSYLRYYDFNTPSCEVYDIKVIDHEIFGTGVGWDSTIINPRQTFFIFKADTWGNLISYKYFHSEDTSIYTIITGSAEYFPCLIGIGDTSFVVCYFNIDKGLLEIFKFDLNLNLIVKNFVPVQNNNYGVFPIRLQYIDGAIYLTGYELMGSKARSFIYRFDVNLNLLSKKWIPGIGNIRASDLDMKGNQFVFSEFNEGDRYVITDTLMKIKKTIQFADRKPDVYHEHLRKTVDGNYLTASYNRNGTKEYTLNIVKRDTLLQTLWKFSMGPIPGYKATVVDIIPAADGAWLAYGQVGANFLDIHNLEPSLDTVNLNILSTVKFTESGKILWQRFDTLEQKYYGMSDGHSGGIAATSDGGALISGDVICFDTVRVNGVLKSRGSYKHFLMKIDSNGCVTGLHCNVEPKIDTMLSTHPVAVKNDEKLTIYPNPTSGMISIDLVPGAEGGQMSIYNAMGVRVEQRKIMSGQVSILLNFTNYPSGRYDVVIIRKDGTLAKGSFVLVK